MMKIAITGSSGLMGSCLFERLHVFKVVWL